MWTTGNYRRIFLDMHLADWHDDFLAKLDPKKNVETIASSGAQQIVVKAKPHTGLCYWPAKIGRMHRGLKGRDYVGEMISLCHEHGIAVMTYYSLIFDNWAYEQHPSWRNVGADGKTTKEASRLGHQKGRYGTVCPNNKEYRSYVMANLKDLCLNYKFEGIFLDMPFWMEICYCPSCKERYLQETGKEMPKIVDWNDPEWLHFQHSRMQWMNDFMQECVRTIKGINPKITIEFNAASTTQNWRKGVGEDIIRNSDYAGGDIYKGLLQESFVCKYYKNVSRTLPFCYITSRCDPNLVHHTATKTAEELLQHAMIALVHNGALSICDGMNPDGTICDEAYAGPIRQCFQGTQAYEPYINGALKSKIQIWLADQARYSLGENQGQHVENIPSARDYSFIEGKIELATILRNNHIPFTVLADDNLNNMDTAQVLVISDVLNICDQEMEKIEEFLNRGGKIYLSGAVGHRRLYELLEAEDRGITEHKITYMRPTTAGKDLFVGYTAHNPMAVDMPQRKLAFHGEHTVLATLTLPYTLRETELFAAIHSDPPGVDLDQPAMVRKPVGNGEILWAAAAIEKLKPYMSRCTVNKVLQSMYEEVPFQADAPSYVEIMEWEKDGKVYFAAINEQEVAPIDVVHQANIIVPFAVQQAKLLKDGTAIATEPVENGTRIPLPPFNVFCMIELIPKAE